MHYGILINSATLPALVDFLHVLTAAHKSSTSNPGNYHFITAHIAPILLTDLFNIHVWGLLSPPRLGGHFASCQQPGSPGWLQHPCLLHILIRLLRKTRYSFL